TNTTLSFPNPVTLSPGTYAIVLNETSGMDPDNYFTWRFVRDDAVGDNDDETQMYTYDWFSSWVASGLGDLFFSYEFVRLNDTDSSKLKNYNTTPEEIDLKFNGTPVTKFTDNYLPLDGIIAEFTSNRSITFDMSYNINYRSNSNPLTLFTELSVNNGSSSTWNNSFTHTTAPSGSFNLNQRNYTIYNLPTDWNETAIYQNGSNYLGSFTYSNGSDQLILHLDQDFNASTWSLQFTSPNYVDTLSLKQNGKVISTPYVVNSSDLLTVTTLLPSLSYTGLNASLFINDFNSALVYSNISVNVNNDNISFENWDISAYLSMITEVSGSYQIIVKWLSDDGTQVGYFGTDIEIITQTSLISPSTISNTIISQDISLEIDFQSVQNTTTLDGADVSYTSSWGEADSLVQSGTRTNYTAVVSTSPASEGPGTLTVNVLLFGYVNHSKTYNLLLLRDTNISAFANGTDFYYNDVVEISIVYENATADNITSAIAQVEGNNAAEQGDGSYLYFFNTTTKDPSSSTFQLNITATKLYHINKSVLLFLNLLTNPTDIILDDFLNIPNGSNYAVVSKDLSSGIDDAFTLFLRYNDTRHSNVIRDATLDHNGSSIASFTGNGSDQDYTNGSWIVEVNPDVGGIFETIMFSFSKDGFNPSFYYITLNISVTDFILDFQIDEPQNVSFGTFHTVTINITEPTFNSSIDGVTITVDPTVFLVNPLGSGLYNLTYFGATLDYIGDFSFLVQFSKVGFSDQNRLFNYSITKPSSPFNTHSILNNGSIVVSEWGDATYLNISFIDSTHGIFLQPLTPPVSNSSSDVLIEYVSSVNGFHLYRVTPLTTGYWIIDLFMDTGLPDYFNTNSSIFTVNASIRTTATVFTFINAPSGVATPQYQRFVDIGILWNDEERGDLKANGTFALDFVWQDNSLTWVEYLNNTDGVHYFRVNGLDMQTHSVDIIFNSSLFASDTAQFSINVAPLQTNELDVSILSGVLLDTTNQTKFGYTTYLVFNWTIQDNNLTIFNPDLVILYNDQILSESSYEIFGIAVLTNSSDFTTHVWISFYKSSDLALGYDIGMQKFDFRFSAFGMGPQSHIFEVFTDGYDLDVTVIFKDKLIPGSDFTIT
ncbi:MAG: hypothetical protein ACXAC2_11960, partial [Candidatus Kariarchaeaceae archaeon]